MIDTETVVFIVAISLMWFATAMFLYLALQELRRCDDERKL